MQNNTPIEMNYSNYAEWKNWDDSSSFCYSSYDSRYYTKELMKCGVGRLRGLRCLEIGFGKGQFAAWATDNGLIYTGTEIIDELVSRGKARGYRVYSSGDQPDISDSSLDLIVAFDVFEHFSWDELTQFLECIHKWLKPGGLLIYRVPSGDSPFSRASQHGDITHKITIGSTIARQLALANNFEIQCIEAPVIPLLSSNIVSSIRMTIVWLGQIIITKFIRIIFHYNKPTIIPANMIVAMRRPLLPVDNQQLSP